MGIENNKLDANELDNVSGGQIIEGKDGKFYVTDDSNLQTFDREEDAKKAQQLLDGKKVKALPYPFKKWPTIHPFLPGPEKPMPYQHLRDVQRWMESAERPPKNQIQHDDK